MTTRKNHILYYIHDPMCSWCWGFHPVLQQLEHKLAQQYSELVSIQYVLGGLATDSQSPMPNEMQHFLQQTWRSIESKIPGTVFNYNFWTNCQPRRSTFPACRSVIAAKKQKPSIEKVIIHEIQKAYYLLAQNPSDELTLIDISNTLGLDTKTFIHDLNSDETQHQLMQEINFSQKLGAQGFPSLVFENNKERYLLQIDYNDAEKILQQIKNLIA